MEIIWNDYLSFIIFAAAFLFLLPTRADFFGNQKVYVPFFTQATSVRIDKMKRINARKGTYSMQGCSHWEETVITDDKFYFKEKPLTSHKPKEKSKREIYNGKSVIPPTAEST